MSHVKDKFENPIKIEQLKFRRHLAKNALKLTKGRKIVFDNVMGTHGHFAAEELVKQCRRKKRKASRATVYRCLRELLEAGVVRETAFGEKHHHYEHLYDERRHHHARCVRCCDHIEFPDLDEDKMYRPLLEKLGFQILGHEMHFYGVCQRCRRSPGSLRRSDGLEASTNGTHSF